MNTIRRLMYKFRTGNYSNDDLNNIIDLMQNPVHEDDVDLSMYTYWNECNDDQTGDDHRFQQVLSDIHHQINLQSARTLRFNRYRKAYSVFSKVAAVIVLPLIVALSVFVAKQYSAHGSMAMNTITVPLGATSQFDLPDGTHIWLNAGSKLTYPMSFGGQKNRLVKLDGEGYFKVKKDKASPFIVCMNGMDVKVTGTTFNARAYSDETNVTVALVEGSVQLGRQLENNVFEKTANLRPLEVAELSKSNSSISLTPRPDLAKYTSWINGITVFDNDPIQDVTSRLEKLYNVKVLIKDQDLMGYRLTATFVDEPLDRALKIISLSSPIDYTIIAGKQNENGTYGQRTLILRKYHKMKK